MTLHSTWQHRTGITRTITKVCHDHAVICDDGTRWCVDYFQRCHEPIEDVSEMRILIEDMRFGNPCFDAALEAAKSGLQVEIYGQKFRVQSYSVNQGIEERGGGFVRQIEDPTFTVSLIGYPFPAQTEVSE